MPGDGLCASGLSQGERYSFERQGKLPVPSFLDRDIARKVMEIFRQNYA